jgi:hypothetical protein
MKIAAAQGTNAWQNLAVRAADSAVEPGNWMEHRWGRRRPCRARVSVSASGGISGIGRLRDVSMSGAFLETAVPLPVFAQLAIAVLRDDGSTHAVEFPAVVVRRDPSGVGIEWCDPGSVSICDALGCRLDCTAIHQAAS